jgi:hypothetical protein
VLKLDSRTLEPRQVEASARYSHVTLWPTLLAGAAPSLYTTHRHGYGQMSCQSMVRESLRRPTRGQRHTLYCRHQRYGINIDTWRHQSAPLELSKLHEDDLHPEQREGVHPVALLVGAVGRDETALPPHHLTDASHSTSHSLQKWSECLLLMYIRSVENICMGAAWHKLNEICTCTTGFCEHLICVSQRFQLADKFRRTRAADRQGGVQTSDWVWV